MHNKCYHLKYLRNLIFSCIYILHYYNNLYHEYDIE